MSCMRGYLGVSAESPGIWTSSLIHTVLTITAIYCIFDVVSSQCSEAHKQTCYWSYLQLEELQTPSTSFSRYIADYNSTTLQTVCRFYKEYRNCSQPFLTSCDVSTVMELHTYDATLGYLCSDKASVNGYLTHKNCFKRLKISHSTCKQKALASMADIDLTSAALEYAMCRSSREYVLCIYTATALGCSMQAADVYFNLLNHSISSMFHFQHYTCTIHHPMDVISIYTTTPQTAYTSASSTTDTHTDRGDNHPQYAETSRSPPSRMTGYISSVGYILLYVFVNMCFCR